MLPQVQSDLGLLRVIDMASRTSVPMLGLRHNMLTAGRVAEVRAKGLGIGAWACNDAAAIALALALGVDVFTTDRPDLALERRAALVRPSTGVTI